MHKQHFLPRKKCMLYFACLCKVNKLSRVSRVIRFLCVALLRTFLFWGVKMQETVNQRIFHIRKLKGYTQADMARTLRVEQIIRTRLKVVYFGAFYPIQSCKALALLRLTRIKIPQNLLTLRSKILKSEDFYSDEAQNAVNPDGLTSILTKYE